MSEPLFPPPLSFCGSTLDFDQASDKQLSEQLQGIQVTRGLRTPTWNIADVGIALGGTIFLSIILALVSQLAHINFERGVPVLIGVSFPWLALAGWPVLVSKVKGNGPQLDFGLSFTKRTLRYGLAGGLASLTAGLLAATITIHLFGISLNSTAGDLGNAQHGVVRVLFALLALFGAPLCEELAFRGLVFGACARTLKSERIASVISAVAFASFHFEPKRFLVLFAIGLVLGEVRIRSRSTSASMIAHMVNNAPAALSILLALPPH